MKKYKSNTVEVTLDILHFNEFFHLATTTYESPPYEFTQQGFASL